MTTAIYEPRGRALEYAPLACNLYRGCAHRCSYCYAPSALRMDRNRFHGDIGEKKDVINELRKDAAMMHGDPRRVLLSFTSDPYQPENDKRGLTRQAIEILHSHGMSVEILSKGGLRACQDFDLLGPEDRVAASLTCLSPETAAEWEPGAAPPGERIEYLMAAKARGLVTWASLEPVLDPEQSLEIIRTTHPFVDKFKVGTLNHHPHGKTIDWAAFGRAAVELLERLGKDYYIKRDLREAMA